MSARGTCLRDGSEKRCVKTSPGEIILFQLLVIRRRCVDTKGSVEINITDTVSPSGEYVSRFVPYPPTHLPQEGEGSPVRQNGHAICVHAFIR